MNGQYSKNNFLGQLAIVLLAHLPYVRKNEILELIKYSFKIKASFYKRLILIFYRIKGINYKNMNGKYPKKNFLGQLAIVLHAHLPYVRKMKKTL